VALTRAMLERHEEISNQLSEPLAGDVMEKLLEELGRVQEAIDAASAWELDRQLEIAMDAMRLPPAMPKRVPSPAASGAASPLQGAVAEADLLLLDEPTNHLDADSVAWLERHLQEYSGTVVAVTHDRYFLDNVAQWILELERGEGHPSRAIIRAGWNKRRRAWRRKSGKSRHARRRWSASSNGPAWPAGTGRQEQGRLAAYEKLAATEVDERGEELRMQIPPARTWATSWSGPRACAKLRRQPAHGGPQFRSAQRRHRRHHRTQRRRQDHALPHDRRRRKTGLRQAPHRRHGPRSYVDQNRDALDGATPFSRKSPAPRNI